MFTKCFPPRKVSDLNALFMMMYLGFTLITTALKSEYEVRFNL